jgi:hypothetical protein
MRFAKDRFINKIQVPVVRMCNRRCPDCCAREQLTWYNKSITKKEMSFEELTWAGRLIGAIDEIEITGGEPTLHPQFEELTNNLTGIFQCDNFMLVSNGWLFGQDPSKLPLLLKYRTVWISHYTEQYVATSGGTTNTREVELISKYLHENGREDWKPYTVYAHHPFSAPPYGGTPCGHYPSNMIAYYEGRVYGCCVSWSLPYQGTSIPLTENWRDHLNEIDLPCEQCFLSSWGA